MGQPRPKGFSIKKITHFLGKSPGDEVGGEMLALISTFKNFLAI